MHKDTFYTRIEEALQKADGNLICRAFAQNLPSEPKDESALFGDPHFVQEVERFIAKNRLSIATAHSRYVLRRVFDKCKEKYQPKPIGEFMVPTIL